ncbi:hypothetical protein [Abyssalbus ytuae]|uniref:Uncharacterized protein n=1 Tax=Abyssalbus ytuae TaxID=2926907 RepID=A0A9E7CZJ3_9FLAO|nr:hypothetical protein [Abyssalbus ytuae]UOB17590.1 hypothetical protein MQE35_17855 [Abyssalbus ytuae]
MDKIVTEQSAIPQVNYYEKDNLINEFVNKLKYYKSELLTTRKKFENNYDVIIKARKLDEVRDYSIMLLENLFNCNVLLKKLKKIKKRETSGKNTKGIQKKMEDVIKNFKLFKRETGKIFEFEL